MYRMKKFALYLAVLILVPVSLSAQERPYNDTAYFIPFDDDFNLIISASKGHLNNVLNLIDRGADVNAVTVDGISGLMYAAENGDLEMVKLLVENSAEPDLKPYNGATALITACQLNNYSIAEYLVSNGASINLPDVESVTALHYAAAYNYRDLVEMLIFYGADIEKADREGNTPLITASFNNCIESVALLLDKGAEINKSDKQGYTALMVATQENNKEIVELLLTNGADVNLINDGGMTALGFAIRESHYELAEKLVRSGADIHHKITKSQNLLELSMEENDDEITELLITEGARKNLYPTFNKMSIGTGLLFCSRDFMLGFDYKFLDSKYNTGINTGFYFRPAAIRIKTVPVNDTLYQYWERRYGFHAGLEKRFNLFDPRKGKTGPVAGINGFYTFGGFRGSTQRPDPGILFNPYAGWFYMTDLISLSAHYEYLNFDIPEFNPGRIRIEFAFIIPTTRKKLTVKRINWLNNN